MIVKWLSPCWVARFGMTFYVYAYYFIPKKDFDLILFLMKEFFQLFHLKKDEIKILFSYEVISINIKSHAKSGNPA